MNMNRQPRNLAASVRARLTNLARTEKRSVQWMLIRYMQERFLYRLAQSKYADGVFGIIEIQRTAAKMSQEKLKIKKA